MELNSLANESYRNAEEKGFYDAYYSLATIVDQHGLESDLKFLQQIWLSHRLMLIVSELAEGLEAIRDNNYSGVPKSGGLMEELADSQIRLADLSKFIMSTKGGDSLSQAVESKMAFNSNRERLHGRSL